MSLFLSIDNLQELLGEKRKILVTGGAGFIGSALIRRLLSKSDAKIFNIDKLSYASDLRSIQQLSNSISNFDQRYEFIHLDLCDFEKTSNVIDYCKPDLIFHLAAESHVDNSIKSPNEFIKSNIICNLPQ